jgi:hypothetical protein
VVFEVSGVAPNREQVHVELERVRATFHRLVETSSATDLRRRTDETRWTNSQLLFHMLLGYFVVRSLLGLVRALGRLPDGVSRRFAQVLNAGTRPFHIVNYLGGCAGALVLRGPRLTAMADRTIDALHRRLDAETDEALERRMHFPTGWDPFFRETMSLIDVYHYGTVHFDFHHRQLTLPAARG